MRKIPTVFKRNPENMKLVTDEVNPVCQWVLDGEGVATRKYDGTGVMLDEDGNWWSRREVKPGKQIPPDFVELDFDEVTGKRQGWVPIEDSPFYSFFLAAFDNLRQPHEPGTYELCGPKIQTNAEGFVDYELVKHSEAETFGTTGVPRTVNEIKKMVLAHDLWEGLVWHHPDGRMAKLKARDLI